MEAGAGAEIFKDFTHLRGKRNLKRREIGVGLYVGNISMQGLYQLVMKQGLYEAPC
jgi:hypothetical protein